VKVFSAGYKNWHLPFRQTGKYSGFVRNFYGVTKLKARDEIKKMVFG
jgi:hypothetical protein